MFGDMENLLDELRSAQEFAEDERETAQRAIEGLAEAMDGVASARDSIVEEIRSYMESFENIEAHLDTDQPDMGEAENALATLSDLLEGSGT